MTCRNCCGWRTEPIAARRGSSPSASSVRFEARSATCNASRRFSTRWSDAAAPYGADVRLLDMTEIFTPDYQYRDAIDVDGSEKLVRRQDGIHLNDDGSEIAADKVLEAMRADFGEEIPGG